MVDKINVIINIFGVEDNIENVDAIEVENEGMYYIKKKNSLSYLCVQELQY